MKRWALYDPHDGTCDFFITRAEAVAKMTARFDSYLGDGTWDEDVEELFVAQITDIPERTHVINRADMSPDDWDGMTDCSDCTQWWEYRSKPVEAGVDPLSPE